MKRFFTLLLSAFFILLSYTSFGQTISGVLSTCTGSTTTLSGSPVGGTWSTSAITIVTVNATTGVATGISAGMTTLTYTTGSGFATAVVTVNPIPSFSLSPGTIVCGGTTTFSGLPSGGLWSITTPFSAPGVATISVATGVITGTSAGTTTVSYRVGTCAATNILTVVPATSGSVSGPSAVCVGAMISLVPSLSAGSWSATNANATVNIVGDVSGVTAGVDTINYTLSGGCGSFTVSHVVTVTTTATIAPITGTFTIPCGGTVTLADATPGGIWTSSNAAIAAPGSSTGIVAGYGVGVTTISYLASIGCGTAVATAVVTVTPTTSAGTISGPPGVCTGGTTTLSSTVSGGTWSTSIGNAVISTAGVVTGITPGYDTIRYTVSGPCGIATALCMVTVAATTTVGSITGTTSITCGGITTLSNPVTGGAWTSSNPAVATIGATTGIVNGLVPGTTIITYTLPSSCGTTTTTDVLTVAAPSVSAAVTPGTCSDNYNVIAGGATTYAWLPTTGVSCPTCATTSINPTATTTYTVTGSNGAGCSSTATVTVNGDRVKGNVTFSTAPSGSATSKVWLVQFNPSDSSIVALDSQLTCFDGTNEYYQFDSKPAGAYLVKASLLSSVAGTSGYIPTYGASSAIWYSGTTINHTGATDVQNIAMIWGTVPSGPGFITGYVYAGAGKGTSGEAPVSGILVYLKDGVTGQILTYTYTDGTGAYTFTGLAYGSYKVYPEVFDYITTPSALITLSAAHPSATAVTFKQYTSRGTITPWALPNVVAMVAVHDKISVYPNPAKDVITIKWSDINTGEVKLVITDIVGREVYSAQLDANAVSGEKQIALHNLKRGTYLLSLQSKELRYSQRVFLDK